MNSLGAANPSKLGWATLPTTRPGACPFWLSPLRTVTTAAGGLGKRSTYRPFGGITDFNVAPAVAAETKGFIGERFDEDSGLQYLNARYYDPELGRFIQPDWFEVTKAGVGTNRYAYAGDDPKTSPPNPTAFCPSQPQLAVPLARSCPQPCLGLPPRALPVQALLPVSTPLPPNNSRATPLTPRFPAPKERARISVCRSAARAHA